MTVTSLGKAQSDTIMSGVVYLLTTAMWPLAIVVFTASVFVPMLKLVDPDLPADLGAAAARAGGRSSARGSTA